jgi:glucokinase
MVIEPDGPTCLCGKAGCVERLASGPYMAQDAADYLATHLGEGMLLRRLIANDPSRINGEMLARAAAEGDTIAIAVLERGARAIGRAIGNVANLLDPGLFVLGGGVTKSGDTWWEGVRRAATATALPEIGLSIVPAALNDDAPLWGAIALAQETFSV